MLASPAISANNAVRSAAVVLPDSCNYASTQLPATNAVIPHLRLGTQSYIVKSSAATDRPRDRGLISRKTLVTYRTTVYSESFSIGEWNSRSLKATGFGFEVSINRIWFPVCFSLKNISILYSFRDIHTYFVYLLKFYELTWPWTRVDNGSQAVTYDPLTHTKTDPWPIIHDPWPTGLTTQPRTS